MEQSKKRKKKGLIIALSVLLFLLVLYIFGGYIGCLVSLENIFSKRMNTPEVLERDLTFLSEKTRADYPSLTEREEVEIPTKSGHLEGYLYNQESQKGLLVSVHGINDLADGSAASYQDYFVREGYALLSYDMTACGKSTGEGIEGLSQARYDLKAVYDYLRNDESLKEKKTCIIAHSMGAYGTLASLCDGISPSGIVSFSAFVSPVSEMKYVMSEHTHGFSNLTNWQLDWAAKSKYGDDSFTSAYDALNDSAVKALLIQGEEDEVIGTAGNALSYQSRSFDRDGIRKIYLPGVPHRSPWLTKESHAYYTNEVLPRIQSLEKKYGKNKVPEEEKKAFLLQVDKDKTSRLNLSLMKEVDDFLVGCLA